MERANCSEANSDAPSPNKPDGRAFATTSGCTDTDNNSADFPRRPSIPRNTASPLNPCYPDTSIDSNPTDPSSSADAVVHL